jgi:hypothetical protein
MPLNQSQQRTLKDWMHSKAIVLCPACGSDRWRFAEAAYVRALWMRGRLTLPRTVGWRSSCAIAADAWRALTVRRWEFGKRGTRGGTCNIEKN